MAAARAYCRARIASRQAASTGPGARSTPRPQRPAGCPVIGAAQAGAGSDPAVRAALGRLVADCVDRIADA